MSKKLEIDGPAGRQEVSDAYRDNYDRIFNPKKPIKVEGKSNAKTKK